MALFAWRVTYDIGLRSDVTLHQYRLQHGDPFVRSHPSYHVSETCRGGRHVLNTEWGHSKDTIRLHTNALWNNFLGVSY